MDIQLIALFTAPIVSIIALVYGYFLSKSILKEDKGNAKLQQIANAVKDGAMSYLATQFKLVFPIMLILAALIAYTLGVGIAATFIVGASFSAIIGYFGMLIAVEANVR